MLIYGRPDVYIDCLRLKISPRTFNVFEVGPDGSVALPSDQINTYENYTCEDNEVLRYVLCKENLSTTEAINIMQKILGSGVKIRYAGLKDANAFTCQYVTVRCRKGRELCKGYRHSSPNYSLNLYFNDVVQCELRRGDLTANKFRVRLTIVEKENECIKKCSNTLNNMSGKKFPNFYGYQRFGSRRPVNHLIGKAVLTGNYEEAIRLIIGHHELSFESAKVREARKLFDEGKLKESLNMFPHHFRIERIILKELIRGVTCAEVLKKISRWYIRFFIEAYQSYLFNRALSELIIQEEGIDKLANRCEVMPLPHPEIRCNDYCAKHVINILKEEGLEPSNLYSKYLRKGARESYFIVNKLNWKSNYYEIVMEFNLPPSTYATVLLREMLRDNLIL